MPDRLAGLLLFLPVPVVLALFTQQPLGAWASLGLGVLLMATHRSYARPFALRRAGRRCLWCGGPAGDGPSVALDEPGARTAWRACSREHGERLRRTLGWAVGHRVFLAAAILGSLIVFLALTSLAGLGLPAGLVPEDAIAVFRLGVAAAVLPLGWLAAGRGPLGEPAGRLPFPVHIQALVGTRWVLWLFRLVGLWWLAAGLLHVARRLA